LAAAELDVPALALPPLEAAGADAPAELAAPEALTAGLAEAGPVEAAAEPAAEDEAAGLAEAAADAGAEDAAGLTGAVDGLAVGVPPQAANRVAAMPMRTIDAEWPIPGSRESAGFIRAPRCVV